MAGGSKKCYFDPIWEHNFVNVNFLRILVMQANLVEYEMAEVKYFFKNDFPNVRTPREELNVRQLTESKHKYVHVLILYDCASFQSWGSLSTKSYLLSIKQSISRD